MVEYYRSLGTDTPDEEPPVGTTIVRELFDAEGEVTKLTMIVKADPEHFPALNGWLFAVFDPDGHLLIEEGQLQLGELESCVSCHLSKGDTHFLFGLPSAARP